MKTCYANGLGDCAGELTREHYVSACVLRRIKERGKESSKVGVVNFFRHAGTPENPKHIGISSLTGRMLCEYHNGALYPVDTEGGRMWSAMENFYYAEQFRVQIDGDKLERWLLKTLCGQIFCGAFSDNLKGKSPPVEWLEMAFNGVPFIDGQGLYYRSQEVVAVDRLQILQLSPLVIDLTDKLTGAKSSQLMGMRAWFFGFEFWIFIGDPGFIDPEWNLSYRPMAISTAKSEVSFEWRTGSASGAIMFGKV